MPASGSGQSHPRQPAERGGLEPQPRSDPDRHHSHLAGADVQLGEVVSGHPAITSPRATICQSALFLESSSTTQHSSGRGSSRADRPLTPAPDSRPSSRARFMPQISGRCRSANEWKGQLARTTSPSCSRGSYPSRRCVLRSKRLPPRGAGAWIHSGVVRPPRPVAAAPQPGAPVAGRPISAKGAERVA